MMTRLLPFLLLSALAHGVQGAEGWSELFPGKDFSAWRQPTGDWTLGAP